MTSAAVADTIVHHIPMCASAPNGPRRNWHPVTITHTLIGVSGGWEAKAHKANSIDVTENHKVHTFVELDKNSPWFLKGVAGPAVQKGGLKPVQVMNAIRHKAIERDTEAAVAEAESAVAANGDANAANHSDSDPDDDPMDQLDDVMETKPATKTKPTPKRTHAWGARSAIVCVDMPARPPCLGLQHVLTQPIWVYRKGKTRNSSQEAKQNLYLRTDCLDWLLSYAADEYHCQGVTRAPETVVAEPKANYAAVAGLRITWDFSDKRWTGMFVSGPYKDTAKTLHTEDVNYARWTKLCMTLKPTDDSYKFVNLNFGAIRGRPSTLRTIAKDLLATWCAAVAEGNGYRFEKEWRFAMSTGRKKPRHDHDQSKHSPSKSESDAESDSPSTGLGVATCEDE